MSDDTAIRVEKLTKIYKLYETPMDRLKESLHPFRRKYHKDFYALNDINFEIRKGETVGVIGKNGSGKSTLLKIITGVLTPTSGSVQVSGKVSALLELGAGFNPELTGIENVYFNGTLLGYSREEMDARLEEILAFADIGEFVHQSVKTYSSGMFIRLAFAVAINVEPEILIIDEAFAVGDVAFQRKCFAKLEKILSDSTLLFVSHSSDHINTICKKSMLLDKGRLIAFGASKKITMIYEKNLLADNPIDISYDDILADLNEDDYSSNVETSQSKALPFYSEQLRSQSMIEHRYYDVSIYDEAIVTLDGALVNVLVNNEYYSYQYKVKFNTSANDVGTGVTFKTSLGVIISAAKLCDYVSYLAVGEVLCVEFKFKCIFMPGIYFTNIGVGAKVNGQRQFLNRKTDCTIFKVMDSDNVSGDGLVKMDLCINYKVQKEEKE